MEASKLFVVEGFGKYISNVVVGVNVFDVNFLRLNVFTEEVVLDVDVFDPGMKERVFR